MFDGKVPQQWWGGGWGVVPGGGGLENEIVKEECVERVITHAR